VSSKQPPPSKRKGKAPLDPRSSKVIVECDDGFPCSSFMEAARLAPPSQRDLEEWQVVTRKKKIKKPASARAPPSPSSYSKVPTDLIGLCFNCFSDRPFVKDCPNPSCCLRCQELGHHANQCRRPWLLLSDNAPHHVGRKRSHPSRPVPITGFRCNADCIFMLHPGRS
jgi:hypothetical protein